MDEAIPVVIVDDHLIIRYGLRAILEQPGTPSIQIVGETDHPATALALVERFAPRVLITDLKLGDHPGMGHAESLVPSLTLIQQVRCTSPHTEVLVITGFDDSDTLLRAIRAGASGCISKRDEINGAEIRAGIAEVARGRRFSSPLVYQRIHTLLQTSTGGMPLLASPLTAREQEVLALIAAGKSNQAIADQLCVQVSTVKSHVSNLLSKLQVPSRELAVLSYHAQQALP